MKILKIIFFTGKEKYLSQFTKNYSSFTQKTKIWVQVFGKRPIPDFGSRAWIGTRSRIRIRNTGILESEFWWIRTSGTVVIRNTVSYPDKTLQEFLKKKTAGTQDM
jgi:hypothetical protein